jgi:HK97 family phage major capsid protein
MADSTAVVEKREALKEKQKVLREVLEEAGPEIDLSKKSILEKLGATDAADATVKFQQRNEELKVLGRECVDAEKRLAAQEIRERDEELKRPIGTPGFPGFGADGQRKSWARLFVESKEFKLSRDTRTTVPFKLDVDFRDMIGMKALMTTAAGFAPESVRSGLLVEKATRPIQVIDLIPSFPISQAAFVYMEETTRTHSAAETAEGAAYPESTFVWTQKTSPVQKIADSIPVTDEQLEDADQVESLLETRLSFGLRQRLDSQILVGNGTPPNLRGLNNVVGIQTRAKGAEMGIVAFARGLNDIRVTGRANPNGSVFHPNDWLDILLTQTAAGDFLFGNPFQGPGPTSVFGVPAAQSDAQTENTVLVGDFANFSRIDNRRGTKTDWGYVGTQFTEGEITLRADLRVAVTFTRPAAFEQLTGM